MSAPKGNKFSPGRPIGAMNKRTIEFKETLEANNYDAALTLIELQREAYNNYEKYKEDKKNKIQAQSYFKDACNLAMDIAGYVYSKPKSIEVKSNSPLEGMSPQQRLEAMKQAVAMLERDVKNENNEKADIQGTKEICLPEVAE